MQSCFFLPGEDLKIQWEAGSEIHLQPWRH